MHEKSWAHFGQSLTIPPLAPIEAGSKQTTTSVMVFESIEY